MVHKSGEIFLPFCHNPRVWRTDGQTNRQTEFSSLDRVCIPCSAVKTGSIWQLVSGLIEAGSPVLAGYLIQCGGRGEMFQYKPGASVRSFTVNLLR